MWAHVRAHVRAAFIFLIAKTLQVQELDKPLAIANKFFFVVCRWDAGSWSPCSQECAGGTQTRTVQCRRPLEEGEGSEVVDPTHCSHELPPVAARSCNSHSCNVTWAKGEWSNVSKWNNHSCDNISVPRTKIQPILRLIFWGHLLVKHYHQSKFWLDGLLFPWKPYLLVGKIISLLTRKWPQIILVW